ncbi:MAG: nucleoside-diphosphate kinase [Patescibacteria group bacterium]|nr:nucleoside-diphosphate kinase [Patescibacteria group bacterium]MDE2172779.1 nucleoside-diphosphate kinase [Patescibacteria group bacterium]
MNHSHPRYERTLVIIKPDGVQRSLIGEVIRRYERSGLKLAAMKMLIPTPDMVETHYTLDPEWKLKTGEKNLKAYRDKGLKPPHDDPIAQSNMILAKLKKYMASGPVVAMVWQGAHAVAIVRKLTGGTEPLMSDVGTIRGDYVLDSYKMADDDLRAIRNIVHASGSVKEAEDEIGYWFKKDEILSYRLLVDQMLYDTDLENFIE